MAVPLESTIMAEIGFGEHHKMFDGNASCTYLRVNAASKIPAAIKSHHDAGEGIDGPNERLCALVLRVAEKGEKNDRTVQHTWKAASDVIQVHVRGYNCPSQKESLYAHIEKYLHETFGI